MCAVWRARRSGAHLLVLLSALLLGAGASTLAAAAEVPPTVEPGRRLRVEAEVDAVQRQPEGAQLLLQVARVDGQPARFRASVAAGEAEVLPGQRILALAKLKPSGPAGNPGQWDRYRLHDRRAQRWSGHLDASQLVVLSPAPAWRTWLERTHGELERAVKALTDDADAAALLLTLAAGQRAELDDAVEEDFARSGLAHILSVSGLHVAVLALCLSWALRRLLVRVPGRLFRRVDPRRAAAPLAVPLVWAYVVFTELQGPAVRSAVMCSLLLLGQALVRRSDPLNALSLAAGALVLADPSSMFDLSLQLSFTAVLALVLLAPLVRAALPVAPPSPASAAGWRLRLQRWREAALQSAVASVAVTLAPAPLVLTAFQRVGVAGILSNVVCLPISGLLTVLAAGGAALFVAAPGLAGPALWLGVWLSKGLLAIAHGFAALPGATLELPAPGLAIAAAWWAGLAALVLLRGRWRLLALAAPAAVALHLWQVTAPREGVDVTFLAVGHGDAILVSSGGRHALIDGGGVPEGVDIGRRVVVPFLRQRGVTRLELAALTHPHPDHALGLASTLRVVPSARLWLPAGTVHGELVDDLVDAAGGAELETLEVGRAPLQLGEALLEVLGPPRDRLLLESENDRSLVLRLRHGEVTFLFPGDVEEAGEEHLDPGRVTVLKAPHHGSDTSSTDAFVARARPKFVVFCVGRFNRFGFPKPEVVARYEAAGARCYRTDADGAVTFHSDGRRVTVETFLPPPPVSRAARKPALPLSRTRGAGQGAGW